MVLVVEGSSCRTSCGILRSCKSFIDVHTEQPQLRQKKYKKNATLPRTDVTWQPRHVFVRHPALALPAGNLFSVLSPESKVPAPHEDAHGGSTAQRLQTVGISGIAASLEVDLCVS